jgi:hypothetical protein
MHEMLKLTYSDVGMHLEHFCGSMETVVTQRMVLALRLGCSICVQPGMASFLMPVDEMNLSEFEAAVHEDKARSIDICTVDEEFYEVSIRGVWIANGREAPDGMFVTAMPERTELYVHKLWQISQDMVSAT